MKRNSLLILLICGTLLLSAAFATVFSSVEYFHRCSGEVSCPVCAEVRQCVSFLSHLLRPTVLAVLLLVPALMTAVAAGNRAVRRLPQTLVSLKILLLI